MLNCQSSAAKLIKYQLFIVLICLCTKLGQSYDTGDLEKERTFIMCKPDAIQRGLIHEIIARFERKGLKLVGMKLIQAPKQVVQEHYAHLKSRPFFPGLVEYITSGPVIPMVWEGYNAVKFGRDIIGETNPAQSAPGTIRGDFCTIESRTVVHGAHSVKEAKREIALWFNEEELVDWDSALREWTVFY